jgi:hypothetical protein
MSLEAKVGNLTRDVAGAMTDSVISNVNVLLKNEFGMTNDQIIKVDGIIRNAIEQMAFNSVKHYVNLMSPERM